MAFAVLELGGIVMDLRGNTPPSAYRVETGLQY